MPASRAPALGEPSRGLSRRQPGDGSRWDGALAARRRGGGEASLAGCARQRERPAGILPATAAASCDSRPSSCGDFLLARLSCENAGISRGRSSVPKAQCGRLATLLVPVVVWLVLHPTLTCYHRTPLCALSTDVVLCGCVCLARRPMGVWSRRAVESLWRPLSQEYTESYTIFIVSGRVTAPSDSAAARVRLTWD